MKNNIVEFKLQFEIKPKEVMKKQSIWVLTKEKTFGQTPAKRLTDELEYIFTDMLKKINENASSAGEALPYYLELTERFERHFFELSKNSVDGYLDKDHKDIPLSLVEINYEFFTMVEMEQELICLKITDNGVGFPESYRHEYKTLLSSSKQKEKEIKISEKQKFESGERLGGAGKGMKLLEENIAELKGGLGRLNCSQEAGSGAIIDLRIPRVSLPLKVESPKSPKELSSPKCSSSLDTSQSGLRSTMEVKSPLPSRKRTRTNESELINVKNKKQLKTDPTEKNPPELELGTHLGAPAALSQRMSSSSMILLKSPKAPNTGTTSAVGVSTTAATTTTSALTLNE